MESLEKVYTIVLNKKTIEEIMHDGTRLNYHIMMYFSQEHRLNDYTMKSVSVAGFGSDLIVTVLLSDIEKIDD